MRQHEVQHRVTPYSAKKLLPRGQEVALLRGRAESMAASAEPILSFWGRKMLWVLDYRPKDEAVWRATHYLNLAEEETANRRPTRRNP